MFQKHTATGCGAGGSGCEKLTGWKHLPNTATAVKFQPSLIRVELIGSDTCIAAGITARGSVLALCRRLVQAGFNPIRPLHAYRGSTLCLVVHSIGEAAGLEINNKGVGFVRHRAVRAGPLVRQKRRGAA
jgi:hypothetical protein